MLKFSREMTFPASRAYLVFAAHLLVDFVEADRVDEITADFTQAFVFGQLFIHNEAIFRVDFRLQLCQRNLKKAEAATTVTSCWSCCYC
jgi:hypothetical protein